MDALRISWISVKQNSKMPNHKEFFMDMYTDSILLKSAYYSRYHMEYGQTSIHNLVLSYLTFLLTSQNFGGFEDALKMKHTRQHWILIGFWFFFRGLAFGYNSQKYKGIKYSCSWHQLVSDRCSCSARRTEIWIGNFCKSQWQPNRSLLWDTGLMHCLTDGTPWIT